MKPRESFPGESMRRRAFLSSLFATASLSVLPGAAGAAAGHVQGTEEDGPITYGPPSREGSNLDRMVNMIDPVLDLHNAHTDEVIRVRFFTATGYDLDALTAINRIMRDWRQDESPQNDPRIFWGLAATRMSAMKDGHNGRQVILSGYRSLKTNEMLRRTGHKAASNSFHLKAQAVDFTMEGIPQDRVGGFVQWLGVGGTGFYPRNHFTHMDSGPVRSW